MDYFDKAMNAILIFMFGLCLFMIFVVLPMAIVSYDGLYQECLKDGHKAYECQGILRGRY